MITAVPASEYTNNQVASLVLIVNSTKMKLTKVSNAEITSTATVRLVPVKLAASWEIRWSGLSICSWLSSFGLRM